MIIKIKNRVMRTIAHYFELKYLAKFLFGSQGIYNFSENDLFLYKTERKAELFIKETSQVDNHVQKITISNHTIYWPMNVPDLDLPWLYHEIFDLFDVNPSSYNHPKMEYEQATWIMDAGCCEGYFSLFARDRNATCSILALEPLIEMKESLNKTFDSEIREKRFILKSNALGKDCGVVKFHFDSEHLCDSSFGDNESLKDDNQTTYEVDVVSIDNLMDTHELKDGGIIKMDIEGAEMDALAGGAELMQKYKPRLAIAVYHGYNNAMKCRDIILQANPEYEVELRGLYGYFKPPRPYILFAW